MKIARRSCPFCGWFMDDSGPQLAEGVFLSLKGLAAAFDKHLAAVERVLQDHLDTHVEQMVAP
jgi:hypothetical protein